MTDTTITDYSKLIDAETWAFIRDTERWYPPETASYPVGRQREIYDAMAQAFRKGYPPGVTARDERVGGVPCRIYVGGESAATVIYFHGGGFVVGGLESHDDVCAEICAAARARVVSADYRLAPEHRHPAHFDDALAVTRATAAAFGGRIVLAGDSAGGNLAAAVAHATRGEGLGIVGQVLVYPGLGRVRDSGSYIRHAEAPMLTREDVEFYFRIRHPEGAVPGHDPTSAPLTDRDFADLPPTVLFAAECDPLADDCAAYADALRGAGCEAECIVEHGLVHGYLRARHRVGRARDSFARVTAAIAAFCRAPEEALP